MKKETTILQSMLLRPTSTFLDVFLIGAQASFVLLTLRSLLSFEFFAGGVRVLYQNHPFSEYASNPHMLENALRNQKVSESFILESISDIRDIRTKLTKFCGNILSLFCTGVLLHCKNIAKSLHLFGSSLENHSLYHKRWEVGRG